MTEDELEARYEAGSRMAWLHMLGAVIRGLGRDPPEWSAARLIAERELAIITLRSLCVEFGDNDWSDDLNLSDIIEKHLMRHIRS